MENDDHNGKNRIYDRSDGLSLAPVIIGFFRKGWKVSERIILAVDA